MRKERAFLENGSKPLEKLLYLATASLFSSIASLLNNYHNHQGIYWFKVLLKQFPDWKILANFVINDLVISAQ